MQPFVLFFSLICGNFRVFVVFLGERIKWKLSKCVDTQLHQLILVRVCVRVCTRSRGLLIPNPSLELTGQMSHYKTRHPSAGTQTRCA